MEGRGGGRGGEGRKGREGSGGEEGRGGEEIMVYCMPVCSGNN